MKKPPSVFHVHMIIACARAVTAQYLESEAVEHVHPLVRNERQLQQVMDTVEANPGIVLYTVVNTNLNAKLEAHCQKLGVPCVSVLEPIFQAYQSFLGSPTQRVVGAQHALNNDYFNRIDALNFTMLHDDGVIPEDVEEADIILLGISRTSKTPTSIYLANRGVKTANIPLVPNVELPSNVIEAKTPLIVTLVASVDRIQQVRQNRLLELNAGGYSDSYADRASIAEELSNARKLSSRYGWPMLDVSRKSIEETAAGILSLHDKHLAKLKNETASQEDQPQ